jgi:hypothetical protein
LLIELRVGARSRDGSHIDNEIDPGLLQQIGKFDDRPGRVAYGEKGVRHGSSGQAHDNRPRIAPIGSGWFRQQKRGLPAARGDFGEIDRIFSLAPNLCCLKPVFGAS